MGKKQQSSRHAPTAWRCSGYTLLQMILVLLVVTTISVVSLRSLEAQKIELAAQTTMKMALQHYELVQKEAVLRQQNCEVQFYGNVIKFLTPGRSATTFVLPAATRFTDADTLRILKDSGAVEPTIVTLRTPRKLIQIRFQLGSGQYVYEEI